MQEMLICLCGHTISLYVDYFNGYLEAVQAEFPDDNITFDFQVTPDMATNSLTAIASGSEHTDLLGIEISGFGLFMADDIIADNFVPLNDMYGDMSQWNPGKVAAWTHTDGNIYGIESEGCYMVYYYNPSILESYGQISSCNLGRVYGNWKNSS